MTETTNPVVATVPMLPNNNYDIKQSNSFIPTAYVPTAYSEVQPLIQNQIFTPSKSMSTCETQTDVVIDLDGTTLTTDDLNEISYKFVWDEKGNRHQMGQIWSEFKTIFVFVRSLLCFTTREYVEDLARIPREYLIQGQTRLVVITCANWRHLRNFRINTRYPYLLFSDTEQEIYNRIGCNKTQDLGKHGDSCHVKSGNFTGIFGSMKNAFNANYGLKRDTQGPIDQQGASLIVGPGPYLHFAHIDKHGRDHFSINSLLNKVGCQAVHFPNQTPTTKSSSAHQN